MSQTTSLHLPPPSAFHAAPQDASEACTAASARMKFGHLVAKSLSRISPYYRTVVVPVPPDPEGFVHAVAEELVSAGWLVSWIWTPEEESALLIRLPNTSCASDADGAI